MIELLLEEGFASQDPETLNAKYAYMMLKDDLGCTALHLACKKGSFEAMVCLLETGKLSKLHTYAVDDRKWNCLHYAMYNGWPKCVNYIVIFDADLDALRNQETTQGKKPFNLAKDDKCKKALHRKFGALNPFRNLGCVSRRQPGPCENLVS